MLEPLRQADRLRQEEAAAAQAWAEEKARLDLLETTILAETEALQRRRQAAEQKIAELTEARPADEALFHLETGAVQLARQIEDNLDVLIRRLPPGLIPLRSSPRADPYEALDEALHRLKRSERATRAIDVSVVTGYLDGEARSVEMVRMGGVAAWWRSLDGAMGGEAAMADGRLVLYPATDPTVLESLRRASDIAKGRRAPEVVVLPVRYVRTSTRGQL